MFPGRKEVGNSLELERILALPRRVVDGASLVASLTEALKTPQGTWTLRPLQAQALHDVGQCGGLFGPLRVGSGKTLITLLAPLVLRAVRPVLLLPAALIGKTELERRQLSEHWRIPSNIRMMSYEMLGREQGARLLDFYKPDLIIADECHKLKNKRAGVTRRVIRYFQEYPATKCVAVSGTIMKSSLRDFAHVARWCLKGNTPLPNTEEELDVWSDALDERTNLFQRLDPGALVALSGGDSDLGAVRRGLQSRLLETPGVVGSTGDQVACSLLIEGHAYSVSDETEKNFCQLRSLWETPDGWAFSEAVELWRHARELALGFHYVWSPRPPSDWLDARREWASFVRRVIGRSRSLDTELQVVHAVDDGKVDDAGLLEAWRSLRPTFKPHTEVVWHDSSALEFCAKWMERGAGIVWCEHVLFAEALSKAVSRPYFGANGVDAGGSTIEQATGAVIASVAANSTGRNLQKWSRNLITSCPMNAPIWEQLLGRTHRDGQRADTVEVDVMIGCSEHVNGFERARGAARAQLDMLGHTQKLLLADVVMPATPVQGERWMST